MRTHIQILAWIYLILFGLSLCAVMYITLALHGVPGFEIHLGGSTPAEFLFRAMLIMYSWVLMGAFAVFVGWGLRAWRQWGRILGIVASAVWLLLGFPALPSIYGLIFLLPGIYGLIVLLWPGAAREFS